MDWPFINNLNALTLIGIIGAILGIYCLFGSAVYTKRSEIEAERYTKFNIAIISAQNNSKSGYDYLLNMMDENKPQGSLERLAYDFVRRSTTRTSIYRYLSESSSYEFPVDKATATIADYENNYESVPDDAKVMYLQWCLGSSPKLTRDDKYQFMKYIAKRIVDGHEQYVPMIVVSTWFVGVYNKEDVSPTRNIPPDFFLDYRKALESCKFYIQQLP